MKECPKCHSRNVVTLNYGKKTGGAIGGVAGGAAGLGLGTAGRAKAGAILGATAGPAGIAVGAIGGAILGCLVAATAGVVTGAKVGSTVDEYILDNYKCLDCKYQFN